jgi:hypothetical protein
VSREQAAQMWSRLALGDEDTPSFQLVHVLYYFGALLVIGAMGWFMTNGWDSFSGIELSIIAGGYALAFVLVGRSVWQRGGLRIPGGLLITMAVCMTPLVVYGIERRMHWWPSNDPGSYVNFHPYINASWVLMEVATVAAALVGLRFFKFPFLTAPIAYALWFMSMDLPAWLSGSEWDYQARCIVSVILGGLMLIFSYFIDGRTEQDFSFWLYFFGLLSFSGGLSAMDSGSQLGKFVYLLVHLGFIAVSVMLRRRVFLVFGALGTFCYLANEAWTYFRDSVAFPFILTGIGIAMIFLAIKYQKNRAAIEAWGQRVNVKVGKGAGAS